jgi:hypothetical protein
VTLTVGWSWLLVACAAAVLAAAAGWVAGRTGGDRRPRPGRHGPAVTPPGAVPGALIDDVIAAHDLSAGSDAVRVQLERVLAAAGVQRMTVPNGAPFDPARHHVEATEAVVPGGVPMAVAREVRPGWTRGDQVIRPAGVVVWK